MERNQAIVLVKSIFNLNEKGYEHLNAIVSNIPTISRLFQAGIVFSNPLMLGIFNALPFMLLVTFFLLMPTNFFTIAIAACIMYRILRNGLNAILDYNVVQTIIENVSNEVYNWDNVVFATQDKNKKSKSLAFIAAFLTAAFLLLIFNMANGITLVLIALTIYSVFTNVIDSLTKHQTFYLLKLIPSLTEYQLSAKRKDSI